MAQRVYWLWLATRMGISGRTAAGLLEYFGDPESIFTADRARLLEYGALKSAQVDALCDKSLEEADRLEELCAKKQIHILTLEDSSYPSRLKNIFDPPIVLYWRGRQPVWEAKPMLSMVGTRSATGYGEGVAERMARGLTEAGFVIVSGMAEGIDGAAHRGALRAGGTTIAVLGCGVDICYPLSNSYLFGDIALAGTLLSEYPPGTSPKGAHFPVRNRIISGLSVATVVVEAPERSGALISARQALDQGRDVFAVPGNLGSPKSAGCNLLIRDGMAQLLTDPVEIVREYSDLLPAVPDEARVRAVFRERTGSEPEAAEAAPKRKKPGLWEQIAQRSARRQSELAEARREAGVKPEQALQMQGGMRFSQFVNTLKKEETEQPSGERPDEPQSAEELRTAYGMVRASELPKKQEAAAPQAAAPGEGAPHAAESAEKPKTARPTAGERPSAAGSARREHHSFSVPAENAINAAPAAHTEHTEKPRKSKPAKKLDFLPSDLSDDERKIIEGVRAGVCTTDRLMELTGFPAAKLLSLITMLELDGLLVNDSGHISTTF